MTRPASSGVTSPTATASSSDADATTVSAAVLIGGRSNEIGESFRGGAMRSRQSRNAGPSPAKANSIAFRVSFSCSPSSSSSIARVIL